MFDLVGIEPTTSSMPWNDKKCILLTAKDLLDARNGKKSAKTPLFAPKLRPKNLTGGQRAASWGSNPYQSLICEPMAGVRNAVIGLSRRRMHEGSVVLIGPPWTCTRIIILPLS